MATFLLDGQRTWSGVRDDEGHRTWSITFLVKGSRLDGPANALNTPGLPLPGTLWAFDNDTDFYAWCRPNATVTPLLDNEPNNYFEVEMEFSTKPPERNKQRCNDVQIEDPILEPPKISGSFTRYTEEATHDVNGRPVVNSAFEQMRGPHVEFDKSRPAVKIEQNLINMQYTVCASMMDCVNDRTLWGLPPRTIKLSQFSWDRKYHGFCYKYYTRTLEFEVNYNTWDRSLLDEGTKVLKGEWNFNTGAWELKNINGAPPDPFNPTHFIRYKDQNGENTRVVLNGRGLPALTNIGTGKRYICISNGTIGIPLSNSSKWIPIFQEDLTFIIDWVFSTTVYHRGWLVAYDGAYYVAHKDAPGQVEPPDELGTPYWTPLINDIVDTGNFNLGTTYQRGQVVTDLSGETGAGSIIVRKYPGVNFLLLGIPAVL